SNRTLPLLASIRTAVGASPSKASSSGFLAPWTLWLAAWIMPPQPSPATTKAAIRPRDSAPAGTLRNGESVGAIGDRPLDAARSNRWNYRKQHSFFATLRYPPNDPIVAPEKSGKRGGNAIWL